MRGIEMGAILEHAAMRRVAADLVAGLTELLILTVVNQGQRVLDASRV